MNAWCHGGGGRLPNPLPRSGLGGGRGRAGAQVVQRAWGGLRGMRRALAGPRHASCIAPARSSLQLCTVPVGFETSYFVCESFLVCPSAVRTGASAPRKVEEFPLGSANPLALWRTVWGGAPYAARALCEKSAVLHHR